MCAARSLAEALLSLSVEELRAKVGGDSPGGGPSQLLLKRHLHDQITAAEARSVFATDHRTKSCGCCFCTWDGWDRR